MNLEHALSDAVQAVVGEAVASASALQTVQAVQAQVTSVDANGKATVSWGGATFGARRLTSYTATANDQVLVLLVGSSPVILGKIV